MSQVTWQATPSVAIEYNAIEYNEDPSWDLRAAYHNQIADERQILKDERRAQIRKRYYLDTDVIPIRDATDAQIERLAMRIAERACNRAEHERRIAMHRERARKGQAW